MSDLGPVTERRFAEAFAAGAVITAKAAAELIGLDVKTLDALSEGQVIRSVPRGKRRAYTERDLRAYLTDEHGASCPSINPSSAKSRAAPRPLQVVGFSQRKGKLRDTPVRRRSGGKVRVSKGPPPAKGAGQCLQVAVDLSVRRVRGAASYRRLQLDLARLAHVALDQQRPNLLEDVGRHRRHKRRIDRPLADLRRAGLEDRDLDALIDDALFRGRAGGEQQCDPKTAPGFAVHCATPPLPANPSGLL